MKRLSIRWHSALTNSAALVFASPSALHWRIECKRAQVGFVWQVVPVLSVGTFAWLATEWSPKVNSPNKYYTICISQQNVFIQVKTQTNAKNCLSMPLLRVLVITIIVPHQICFLLKIVCFFLMKIYKLKKSNFCTEKANNCTYAWLGDCVSRDFCVSM